MQKEPTKADNFAWGFLYGLQKIIENTNGEHAVNNLQDYTSSLMTWFLEVSAIVYIKGEKSEEIKKLYIKLKEHKKEIEKQEKSDELDVMTLRNFHMLLNLVSTKCSLRMSIGEEDGNLNFEQFFEDSDL